MVHRQAIHIVNEVEIMSNKVLGGIFLTIAASIWGGMFVAVKLVVDLIPPIPLVWFRYLIAFIVLSVVVIYQGINLKIDKKDIFLLISIGVIGHTISIVTQEYGTMYSSAQMGSVVTSATPAFMLIFAVWLLNEKITLRKILSVILATIGVIMIAGIDNMDFDRQLGVLFSTIAALTWALMSVMLKLIPSKYPPLLINFYAVITGIICLMPFNLPNLGELPWQEILNPIPICAVVYLGGISTAGAFLLWNKGLLLMEAGASGLFFFFQPIVGTFLGWLILDEQITFSFWLGSILIFVGVFLVTVRNE